MSPQLHTILSIAAALAVGAAYALACGTWRRWRIARRNARWRSGYAVYQDNAQKRFTRIISGR